MLGGSVGPRTEVSNWEHTSKACGQRVKCVSEVWSKQDDKRGVWLNRGTHEVRFYRVLLFTKEKVWEVPRQLCVCLYLWSKLRGNSNLMIYMSFYIRWETASLIWLVYSSHLKTKQYLSKNKKKEKKIILNMNISQSLYGGFGHTRHEA